MRRGPPLIWQLPVPRSTAPRRRIFAATIFNLILSSLIFSGSVSWTSPVAAGQNVLRVLAWPGYADSDVVKTFEARFNARVEVTLVDSDEALWDRMHTGDTPAFDVLAANTAEIARYTREHLLAPLDLVQPPQYPTSVAALSRVIGY